MEPLGNPSSLAGENFLEVPTLCDLCDDDEDVKVTFKPRFSPLPRRRSSVCSDDADSEAPSNIARKVSFADAFGLDLVSVKEFDTWEIPTASQNDAFEDDVIVVEAFSLSPVFQLPTVDAVQQEVRAEKVVLESLDFQPGVASVKGIVRVLNIAFEKSVYVRMSLDGWLSYYDILAEYVPHSCDGETDQFSFKISSVPPYQKDGAAIEFCIRYETPVSTFWANNNGSNYMLRCNKKETLLETDKRLKDASDRLKKSCLKTNQR